MKDLSSPRSPNHSLYLIKLHFVLAILRETSRETSYKIVRLVFRRYSHVPRSICTSESLCASTRLSSGFGLHTNSSLSFGYEHVCYHSNPLRRKGRLQMHETRQGINDRSNTFITRQGFMYPLTRKHVRLLGPCFKTGKLDSDLASSGELKKTASTRQHQLCEQNQHRPTP